MKKIIGFITAFVFMITLLPLQQVESAGRFKDVANDHWAKKEIEYLSNKGVIGGFKDGSFRPNANITNAQMAIMVAKELGLENRQWVNPGFSDINGAVSGYREIAALVDEGIINKAEKFYPESPATRESMSRILVSAFKLKGSQKATFKDVSKNHPSYQQIDAIASNEITFGYKDNTFRPNESLTRAQFSAFMARVSQSKNAIEKVTKGSIRLDKTNLFITENTIGKLTLNFKDKKRKELNNQNYEIRWYSENENIATVDQNGNVKGIYPGKTKVFVSVDGITTFCVINVKPIAVTSIQLPTEIKLIEGHQEKLTAILLPDNAHFYKLEWTSSDKNIVTVDSNGQIKGINPGKAKIKAKVSGTTTIFAVTEIIVQDEFLAALEGKTYSIKQGASLTEVENFLNQNYGRLVTPMGAYDLKYKMRHYRQEALWPEYYRVDIMFEYNRRYPEQDFFYTIEKYESKDNENYHRIELDENVKNETIQKTRNFGKEIYSVLNYVYPNKNIEGSFYESWFRYPAISEGYEYNSYYGWANYRKYLGESYDVGFFFTYEWTIRDEMEWQERLENFK